MGAKSGRLLLLLLPSPCPVATEGFKRLTQGMKIKKVWEICVADLLSTCDKQLWKHTLSPPSGVQKVFSSCFPSTAVSLQSAIGTRLYLA